MFIVFASLGNVCKGIAGLANGATKASLNKHFGTRNNLGDLTARTYIQGTLAYLLGMGIALGYNQVTDVLHNTQLLWFSFGVSVLFNIFCGIKGLSHVVMTRMNRERALLVFDHYIKENGKVLTPEDISGVESLLNSKYDLDRDVYILVVTNH